MPHAEHSVRVSVRERPAAAGPVPAFRPVPARLDLHGLQRFGSFVNLCRQCFQSNRAPSTGALVTAAATAEMVAGTGAEHTGVGAELLVAAQAPDA